jgi:hypothetical protein
MLRNECEFRAYFLLLQAGNLGGTLDLIAKMAVLSKEVLESTIMKLAIEIHAW